LGLPDCGEGVLWLCLLWYVEVVWFHGQAVVEGGRWAVALGCLYQLAEVCSVWEIQMLFLRLVSPPLPVSAQKPRHLHVQSVPPPPGNDVDHPPSTAQCHRYKWRGSTPATLSLPGRSRGSTRALGLCLAACPGGGGRRCFRLSLSSAYAHPRRKYGRPLPIRSRLFLLAVTRAPCSREVHGVSFLSCVCSLCLQGGRRTRSAPFLGEGLVDSPRGGGGGGLVADDVMYSYFYSLCNERQEMDKPRVSSMVDVKRRASTAAGVAATPSPAR
jgi:hypothetical protein